MRYNPTNKKLFGSKTTILVLEDDVHLSRQLLSHFESKGHRVLLAYDCLNAIQKSKDNSIDIAIIDRYLHDEHDGIEVLQYLRDNPKTASIPVIIMTAKASEKEKRQAHKFKPDIYLTKPFSCNDLYRQVEVLLGRYQQNINMQVRLSKHIVFNASQHSVIVDNQERYLSKLEFNLLMLLYEKNRVLTKEYILDYLWEDKEAMPHSLDILLSRLRNILSPYRSIIRTVHGVGYELMIDKQ